MAYHVVCTRCGILTKEQFIIDQLCPSCREKIRRGLISP